jgi:drug/metabolite transporter (DMT)-like permease
MNLDDPSPQIALLLALVGNLLFAGASLLYRRIARLTSSDWMNLMKAGVASLGFFLMIYGGDGIGHSWPTPESVVLFAVSGILGLAIGDYFMVEAFLYMGPGRVLTLYRLQPVILAVASAIWLGQSITIAQSFSIFLMFLTVSILMYERYHLEGKWTGQGVVAALVAMSLDTTGIFMTRLAFEKSADTSSSHANFIRAGAAVLSYIVIARFRPLKWSEHWQSLTLGDRSIALLAPVFGTFLSLLLWLAALRYGHLASVTAVGAFGPLFSLFLESLLTKKLPTRHAVAALITALLGFALLF